MVWCGVVWCGVVWITNALVFVHRDWQSHAITTPAVLTKSASVTSAGASGKPGSAVARNKFNLKESLAKPVTWVMKTGKIEHTPL